MFEIGYGQSAFTIASHLTLSVALGLLVWRLLRMLDGEVPAIAIRRGWVAGLAIFAWGLLSERAYYIAARLLRPLGVDLWQMHPAPEVLSVMVFLTLYALKGPLVYSQFPPDVARRRIGVELGWLCLLWGGLVAVFY